MPLTDLTNRNYPTKSSSLSTWEECDDVLQRQRRSTNTFNVKVPAKQHPSGKRTNAKNTGGRTTVKLTDVFPSKTASVAEKEEEEDFFASSGKDEAVIIVAKKANAQPANTTLKSAKHLSPPKKTTTKANTNDDSDDDWESWGCSSEDSNVAAEARRRSEQHTKKTSERASVPLASKKFQCVPTPMEQIALGSSNSSKQQQAPRTPSSNSARGGFGSNNNNKKNFTRLYRTSSPERKAASPTAQVIQSIDEAVDSVLTKSYTGLVGAVSSFASTLDAAVETTALKLDHFASQKMSPPGGRPRKSRTTEDEDPMSSPNVIKMRCRESLGSTNSSNRTSTSSSNNNKDNGGGGGGGAEETKASSSSSSWENWDEVDDNNKENVDPNFPQTPRRLSKHLLQQNKHLQRCNASLTAQVDVVAQNLREETAHRKLLQRDIDLLKKQNLGLQKRQQSKHNKEEEDKLMEQVRVQLQQLIKEKSELTAQNERLVRENEQLHGFLSHMSSASDDDD
ncbi:unnamed protein product [Bathycoccus prasinos]